MALFGLSEEARLFDRMKRSIPAAGRVRKAARWGI